MRVDAHTASARRVVKVDRAGTGHEIVFRIFGVDPALNGMVPRHGIEHVVRKRLPRGDLELLLDQIATVDFLRDGMLDLDAGVHLHEVKVAGVVDQELDGAGILVIDRLGQGDGGLAHALAQLFGHDGGRTLLDDLLVAALHGAITLPEMNHIALAVGNKLELDVVRILDEFFDVDCGVAKGFLRLGARAMETIDQRDFIVRDTHAASATPRHGLDHHGETDLAGDAQRLAFRLDNTVAARRDGHPGLDRLLARHVFVAHQPNGFGGRTDEFDFATGADLGEMGVFGEEAVARVDGVRIGNFGRTDDAVDLEVALRTRGRADANGLVGQLNMEGLNVGLRVNGDAADAEFLAGADDAQGDLSAVGNKETLNHVRSAALAAYL